MNRVLACAALVVLLVAGLIARVHQVDDLGETAEKQNSHPLSSTAPPTSPAPAGSARNGVEQLPAHQILARAKGAVERAGSVHLVGVVREGNQPVELDLRLQGGQGVGLIRSNGTSVMVIKAGSDLYVQGDDTFYEQFGGAEAARLLKGKWLRGSSGRSPLSKPASLFSVDKLLVRALLPKDKVVKGGETLVGDVPAIELRGETTGSTVHVALTGEPYPLSVEAGREHTGKGHIRFSDWGEPVHVQAPPADTVVEPTQLDR